MGIQKKGIGDVVGWVLLLGFTIGLATMVFMWTTQTTEESSKKSTAYVEGGMLCENVMINVALETACLPTQCCLRIANTRYLNITKVVIRDLDPEQPAPNTEERSNLGVNDAMIVKISGWNGDKVEVLPVITLNDELLSCSEKSITTQC